MHFDYIIIGAGSAGCVLANRLSSDGSIKVLLLEAGPENKALSLKMPAAMLGNLNSKTYNWAFEGEPEPELNGRRLKHDRGKTLGGSSSINGMVFIRGHELDFEGWRQSGCEGWGYADVLPYFKRMESYDGGADAFRGDAGPLHVHRPEPDNPLALAFLKAGAEAGYPVTRDISGYRQEGFGLLDRTTFRGERWSTARAYLDPVRKRANLKVVTRALVERICLEDRRATGVVFRDHQGRQVTAWADREVILSAGAVGSPHILMLSGIGPRPELQGMGIDVVADLPGVGANLSDHPDFVMKYRCLQPVSLWPRTRLLARVAAGLQWLVTRKGIGASNHFDTVACVRSGPGVEYPDLQFTLSPIAMAADTWAPMHEHAFQIHMGLMRAHSRGRITLRNADPATPPRILINYLEDPRDRELMRKGIGLIRELVDQPAFASLRGDEIFPGMDAQSDEELDRHLKTSTASQWHLTGTARMGTASDQGAVVDAQGRVHGIDRLRVADASIMPNVTNGNTNSPTIMIAEKLSDAILGKTPLAKVEAKVWQNPAYATRQR